MRMEYSQPFLCSKLDSSKTPSDSPEDTNTAGAADITVTVSFEKQKQMTDIPHSFGMQ